MQLYSLAVTVVCLLFLLVRSLFSAWDFPLSQMFSLTLSALVPALALRFSPLYGAPTASLSFSAKKSAPYLLFSFSFVPSVFGLSCLCSYIALKCGIDTAVVYQTPFWREAIVSAALAALSEEFVFRFLVLRQLAVYDRFGAVAVSSVLFALMHTDPVQLPYALFAGFLLGAVTLSCGSVFPAIVMHFGNNFCSLLISYYKTPALVSVLSVCSVGSVLWAFWFFRSHNVKSAFTSVFSPTKESGKTLLSLVASPLLAVVLLLLYMIIFK